MVNIIVGLKDDHKSLKELEKYGEIIHYLDLIHAVAMKVPGDKIPLIKTLRFVQKVEKSRKLTVMHCL